MADEVMVIEGIFANGEKEREGTNMASILNSLKDDLTDTKAWMNGAKAVAGGAVGRAAFPLIFKALGKISPKLDPANPLIRLAAQGIGGVLLGVIAERYVGETVAAGFIGGASGGAVASVANMGLEKVSPSLKLDLGDIGDNALSPEERAFLSGVAGRGMGEVAVEQVPLLNEVGVETYNPLADVDAEQAVLFS